MINSIQSSMVVFVTGENSTRASVATTLHYRIEDPWAVAMEFHTSKDHNVTWVFARDLLLDGKTREVGEGDVSIKPGLNHSIMRLSNFTGKAILEIPQAPLEEFLDATVKLVKPGQESQHVDIDTELTLMLMRNMPRGV